MATTTRRLTSAPQNRKKHSVYRNGKLVRVYYTDTAPSTAKDKTRRGPSSTALKKMAIPAKMLWEARNYGIQFVQQKYKLSSKMVSAINKANIAKGRNAGQSQLNAPPSTHGEYTARANRFTDGGPAQAMPPAPTNRFLQLNLENDSELAQGQHHQWAQSTSVSSLITSQLRQAQNSAVDYWDQWSKDKTGQTNISTRDSSPFGVDVSYTSGATSQLSNENPMGAFGTNAVMDPEWQNQEVDNSDLDTSAVTANASAAVYNPWSEGEGGQANAYGPSSDVMAQSTLEAMALANAYFAPQRMELAYALGDMETDMRRLAVNLGRQVDDPVLQAKLYKEGMRAVRTLDVQQNTLAFQMAEQRRREELSNFQFYDSLAQQEYNIRKTNEQFYQRLDLDNAYFGLKKDELNMMAQATNPPTPNTETLPGTENSPVNTQPTSPTAPLYNQPARQQGPVTVGNITGLNNQGY